MIKLRKKIDTNENEPENEIYDSMIENGTSESDSDASESESDDEFSEKEENFVEKSPSPVEKKRKKFSIETNKKKLKTTETEIELNKLYKPPTVEEINQLKETENLFHSNLFRMQIDEMLKELKIKDKYQKEISEFVTKFNDFLKNLKSQNEKEEFAKLKWLKNFKIPINLSKFSDRKFYFQFLKPEKPAFLIGSQAMGTLIGPELICDLCVLMPAKSFQKNDYLNLIYDQKRALYLTYLAKKMKNFGDLKFTQYRSNPYKPILEISSRKKLKFRIFIAAEQASFKLNRFVPWNSNIRESLFNDQEVTQDEILYSSPNYNANFLFDLTMESNEKYLSDIISKNKNLQEGLILIKIWLRQRQLSEGFVGITNLIITAFSVWLFKQKKIHSNMSSYQITRNIWINLAASLWNEDGKGITLCEKNDLESNQPTLDQMHSSYDIVFIDSTGFLNFCANLSMDNYLRLKFESSRAIELLNNYKINSFQQLFMINFPVYAQFDHIFGVDHEDDLNNLMNKIQSKAEKQNYAGYWFPIALKLITNIIRKGLSDRILFLTPIENSSLCWDLCVEPPLPTKSLRIGLVLNFDTALQILNKGPQANEEKEADSFREFWGSKSELRRFQDGSITEACVWGSPSDHLCKKRLIVKEIVTHLLNHHFNINNVTYLADQFDLSFKIDKTFLVFENGDNDAENTALEVIKSFDDLGKKLRSLTDLPLEIISIQGVSSVLRYCDPVPTLPQARVYKDVENKIYFQSYKTIKGVIQLGASGKWPGELNAFRRLKIAFYLQISQSLREKFKLETRGSIDGIYVLKDGFVFCLEISHQKEFGLLKKEINSKGIITYNDTKESFDFEKNLIILPKITSNLHGLYQNSPAYGPTVMIAKRWLYSQLIDNHLWPDDCTELLIAYQFFKMSSFVNPCQPQTGFLRFLKFLANTDFENEFFMLNLNDEIVSNEITELEYQFQAERNKFPPVFIVTSYDNKKSEIWCKRSPTNEILGRVIMLARHALLLIEPCFQLKQILMVEDLFIPSLDGYDVVINLKTDLVQTCLAHDFDPNVDRKIDATIPSTGFNPIEKALRTLREAYNIFAIFFYNPCGGKEILVLWRPETKEFIDFKLSEVNGFHISENEKLKFNVNAIIEDFKIILKGLYQSVDTKS